MRSKLSFTVKCLLENRLRFFLTVLSISVAVTSVLLINAVSSFGVQAVWSELDSLGMNGLIVSADTRAITDSDVESMENITGVEKAAPVTVNASKVCIGGDLTNAMVWGIDEKAEDVVSFELLCGRFIDKGDIRGNARVCMIDQSLAGELFGSENAVGRTLELLCDQTVQSFEVVGIVKTGKGIMQSLMGSYFPAFLYVPYSSVSAGADFNQVFLKTDGAVASERIAEGVKHALPAVTVADLASQKGVLEGMLGLVRTVLTVIGAISLLVSGISIMNIMLISVNERTKEIGIKKSIGASSGDIMLDFLAESVIIAFAGTSAGILFACAAAFAASTVFSAEITISLASMVTAVVTAALLGMLFGIFPAYKASRFRPVEALRR